MASVPLGAPAAELDRRQGTRSELCLGVILRRAGEEGIVSAEITNLSATGFLAEFPQGAEIPAVLDVELPHAGSRAATVVWTNGWMVGCSFSKPLTRSEISAAHLKSQPRQISVELASAPFNRARDLSDPIWDTANEARPEEKWPLRTRLLMIGAMGALPWLGVAGVVALFA
jgi:hypothetical protein